MIRATNGKSRMSVLQQNTNKLRHDDDTTPSSNSAQRLQPVINTVVIEIVMTELCHFAYRVVHQPVSRGFAVFADAWLSGWLAEISADLRETVAH